MIRIQLKNSLMQSSFINLTSNELEFSSSKVTSNGTVGTNIGSSQIENAQGHSFVAIGPFCDNIDDSIKDRTYGQIDFKKIKANEWYGSGGITTNAGN